MRSSAKSLRSTKKIDSTKIKHSPRDEKLRSFVHPRGSLLGFQIYFDRHSKSKLDPGWNPYFNRNANVFMEAQVMSDLIDGGYHRFADYFGVFSWKLSAKHHTDSQWIFASMVNDRFRSDLYTFDVGRRGRSVWHNEPQMRLAIAGEIILRKIGVSIDLIALRTRIIMSNHFICRSEIYEEFQRDFLKPCLEVMSQSEDEALQALLHRDSGHIYSDRVKDRVKKIYGGEHYSLHPFITEQLFATWWALKESKRNYRTLVLPPRDPAHPAPFLNSLNPAH